MKTFPQKPPEKGSRRDFSHLSPLESIMRFLAILLVTGVLLSIFLKVLFF